MDDLTPEIREELDSLLADTSYTYQDISDWLKEQGHDISKSAVGRYALKTNSALKRLMEAQEQARALVAAVQKNPEVDYTEATMQLLLQGLTEKMVSAEEEFAEMPLDKAGRLVVALSRTKTYKDRVRQDMAKKADLALEGMRQDLQRVFQGDAALSRELDQLLEKAKRMMTDETD